MITVLRSAAVIALAPFALRASAAPIAYAFRTVGDGTLNGVGFTGAAVSIVGVADTDGIVSFGPRGKAVQLLSTTVTVEGVGSDSLTEPFAAYSDPLGPSYTTGSVGLFQGLATFSGPRLLTILSPDLATYDLASALGPVAASNTSDNPNGRFATIGGSFSLGSTRVRATSFTAQPVPEPATMAALGLGAVALIRRRKRA